jgi:hypothetical protein
LKPSFLVRNNSYSLFLNNKTKSALTNKIERK